MPFKQFIAIPVFIAFQAFTMMLLAPFVPLTGEAAGGGLTTWIAFQAWAMYFLGGCNVKMAGKTLIGYIGGIIASVAIFELAGVFGALSAGATPWGLYLAVFIVVIFVICVERIPGLDFVPSYFIGAGVFFALFTYLQKPDEVAKYTWYLNLAVPEIVACVIGLAYGWWTVTTRTWYEARIAKPKA